MQPTAALAIICTTVSRAAWLYNGSSFTLHATCTIPIYIRRPFIVFALRSFFRLPALHLHAFEWRLATSPAGSAPSYNFSFHNSIFADLPTLHSFILLPSSHLALYFVDSHFHYGTLPSSLSSVHQRPLVFRVHSEALKSPI